MNNLNIYTIVITSLLYMSCSDCQDILPIPCGPGGVNTELCGWTIATCYALESSDPVGVIYNTSKNHLAPINDNWGSTIETIHPSNWTAKDIGQIFGIAIDNQNSVYLASSDIYYYDSGDPNEAANVQRPNPCGRIFIASAPNWVAQPWVDLPSSCKDYVGIGNIVNDPYNNLMIATNLEDGKLYRIDIQDGQYDSFDPFMLDDGIDGIATDSELIWGVGIVNENNRIKVYFSRTINSTHEIYSIQLNDDGEFPINGSEKYEFKFPSNSPINKITDISFSDDGNLMLLAERGDAHKSGVYKYVKSDPDNWSPSQIMYYVGGFSGQNVAGGIDFSYTSSEENTSSTCNESFWVSGNYMMAPKSSLTLIYGITNVSIDGNNSNQDSDLFIDFDGVDGAVQKYGLGDVEVFDCHDCFDPCRLKDFAN